MTKLVEQLRTLCHEKNLRLTSQRYIIAHILSAEKGHLSVEQIHQQSSFMDSRISLATVYRVLKFFEEHHLVIKHLFAQGKACYEGAEHEHHDHLIDVCTGQIIEFSHEEVERLQADIAQSLGYKLVGHRFELHGVPLPKNELSQTTSPVKKKKTEESF